MKSTIEGLLYSGKPRMEALFFGSFAAFYLNLMGLLYLAGLKSPYVWVLVGFAVLFGSGVLYASHKIDPGTRGG